MRIGLIADTHDNLPIIQEAVTFFKKIRVQHILHAGDIISPFSAKALAAFPRELFVIFGNNDGEKKGLSQILKGIQEPPMRIELAARKILLVHDILLLREEDKDWADVVVHGHTHKASLEEGNPLLINPGEAGGWLAGVPTVGLLDLEKLRVEILSLEDGELIQGLTFS